MIIQNGGTAHCAFNCCNFDNDNGVCKLRKIRIEKPLWTYCRNFNKEDKPIIGERFSIVYEVKNRAGNYHKILYYRNPAEIYKCNTAYQFLNNISNLSKCLKKNKISKTKY